MTASKPRIVALIAFGLSERITTQIIFFSTTLIMMQSGLSPEQAPAMFSAEKGSSDFLSGSILRAKISSSLSTEITLE